MFIDLLFFILFCYSILSISIGVYVSKLLIFKEKYTLMSLFPFIYTIIFSIGFKLITIYF
jgi:hypothetical protein